MKTRWRVLTTLLMIIPLCLLSQEFAWCERSGPPDQAASLVYNEMRTVYLGNLARRDHGVPPLRWNAQMTEAARWFSWDSVENRPDGYCGHLDTLGRWHSERVPLFGYQGASGAENCYCAYMSPQDAIDGWMDSPGHRANLLDSNSRELGMGYYRRESDGRGYLTQDFGVDDLYPPVVINNEALKTTSPGVRLYIHSAEDSGGFTGMGQARQMMVANNPCFNGARWESYAPEKSWDLESGTNWRSVYVKTRDTIGQTAVVSDSIYVGQDVPMNELGLHLASTTKNHVTIYGLDGDGLPYVQFSQNWFADDTNDTFGLLWGNGERVNDETALGGTAFRMRPGDGESSSWVWTTSFFKEVDFVAYARLKVSDNTSTQEVARFSVKGGGTEYGPLRLKGIDFRAPNTYQTFPLAFTFHDNPDDVFLTFQFWRSGDANVTVDGAYIFTAPQPVQSPLTWHVPGGNYRGGGIWLRYTDGAGTFSSVEEAETNPPSLAKSVNILPKTKGLAPGECVTFTLTSQDAYGNTSDVTSDADTTFTANGGGVMTDNEFCAEALGEWTVTGTYSGRSYEATMMVEFSAASNVQFLGARHMPKGAFAVDVVEDLAYVGDWEGLRVLDVSDPAEPTLVGSCDGVDLASDVTVRKQYAYISTGGMGFGGNGLRIISVRDPGAPEEVGFWDEPPGGWQGGVDVCNSHAYVVYGNALSVIDVSNPVSPVEEGLCVLEGGDGTGLATDGSYVYTTRLGDGGLSVIDVSTPSYPLLISSYEEEGDALDVTTADNIAYLVGSNWENGSGWLRVINVSDPSHPTQLGVFEFSRPPSAVALDGDKAHVVGGMWYPEEGGWLSVVDVSDPTNLAGLGHYEMPYGASDVDVADNIVYIADGETIIILRYMGQGAINRVCLPLVVRGDASSPPANRAPNTPSVPSPPDGATDQSVDVNLTWTGGDPDGDSVAYDVYLETNDSSPDTLVCTDRATTQCAPDALDYGTHYYWQVVAKDDQGTETVGPVWDFMTESAMPTVWVEPAESLVMEQDTFTVEVMKSTDEALSAFEFFLQFDPSKLEFVDVGPGADATGLVTGSLQAVNVVGVVGAQAGTLVPAGTAAMAEITFEALDEGTSMLDVLDVVEAQGTPYDPVALIDTSIELLPDPEVIDGKAVVRATVTLYAESGDGEVLNIGCSEWNACRNASSGSYAWSTYPQGTVQACSEDASYRIKRVFFFFDTSALPAAVEIDSASLRVHVNYLEAGDSSMHVVQSEALLPLSVDDFGRVHFASGGSVAPESSGWTTIDLNAGALEWIDKGGVTKLALVHDLDVNDVVPSEINSLVVVFADDSEHCPSLQVTYSH